MKKYYEILEIDKNASKQEIRKAYSKLLRIHSPEKSIEKYTLITEAYKVLYDDEKRKTYDIKVENNDELMILHKEAKWAKDIEDIDEGISLYNKILEIDDKDQKAINGLGYLYVMADRYKEAIDLFDKMTDVEDTVFLAKMAKLFDKDGQVFKVEEILKQIKEINPEDETIKEFYIEKGKEIEAIKYYEEKINKAKNNKFKFIYLVEVLPMYKNIDDAEKVRNTLRNIRGIDTKENLNSQETYKYIKSIIDCISTYQFPLIKKVIPLIKKSNLDEMKKENLIDEITNSSYFFESDELIPDYFKDQTGLLEKILEEDYERFVSAIEYIKQRYGIEFVNSNNYLKEAYERAIIYSTLKDMRKHIPKKDRMMAYIYKLYKEFGTTAKIEENVELDFEKEKFKKVVPEFQTLIIIKQNYPYVYNKYQDYLDRLYAYYLSNAKDKENLKTIESEDIITRKKKIKKGWHVIESIILLPVFIVGGFSLAIKILFIIILLKLCLKGVRKCEKI